MSRLPLGSSVSRSFLSSSSGSVFSRFGDSASGDSLSLLSDSAQFDSSNSRFRSDRGCSGFGLGAGP